MTKNSILILSIFLSVPIASNFAQGADNEKYSSEKKSLRAHDYSSSSKSSEMSDSLMSESEEEMEIILKFMEKAAQEETNIDFNLIQRGQETALETINKNLIQLPLTESSEKKTSSFTYTSAFSAPKINGSKNNEVTSSSFLKSFRSTKPNLIKDFKNKFTNSNVRKTPSIEMIIETTTTPTFTSIVTQGAEASEPAIKKRRLNVSEQTIMSSPVILDLTLDSSANLISKKEAPTAVETETQNTNSIDFKRQESWKKQDDFFGNMTEELVKKDTGLTLAEFNNFVIEIKKYTVEKKIWNQNADNITKFKTFIYMTLECQGAQYDLEIRKKYSSKFDFNVGNLIGSIRKMSQIINKYKESKSFIAAPFTYNRVPIVSYSPNAFSFPLPTRNVVPPISSNAPVLIGNATSMTNKIMYIDGVPYALVPMDVIHNQIN